MEHTFSPRIAATLNHRAGDGATAARIADAVAVVCQDIERSLTPVMGPGGVAALFLRSLYLARTSHGWISSPSAAPASRVDLSIFLALVAQQTDEEALAGGRELLETFSRLLVSLIGSSLSEQLLGSVWIQPTEIPPAQDAP